MLEAWIWWLLTLCYTSFLKCYWVMKLRKSYGTKWNGKKALGCMTWRVTRRFHPALSGNVVGSLIMQSRFECHQLWYANCGKSVVFSIQGEYIQGRWAPGIREYPGPRGPNVFQSRPFLDKAPFFNRAELLLCQLERKVNNIYTLIVHYFTSIFNTKTPITLFYCCPSFLNYTTCHTVFLVSSQVYYYIIGFQYSMTKSR